ncbi:MULTISPECIES: hypothetical protein [unclassified Chelatococcus]|uniref:hypothetical protein n=1 Tax=unclassified Chelatococcus TaxID=2638111 RepID=UPI001BCA758C|nr:MULTISPECIES: hypothetical protein [unclassified Chelatococcus]MBS7700543.1 hypothetical protein [Chelatococcus sp. YT9]MBX3558658.1 hypothetical protein [Chelatococcus sp.]
MAALSEVVHAEIHNQIQFAIEHETWIDIAAIVRRIVVRYSDLESRRKELHREVALRALPRGITIKL